MTPNVKEKYNLYNRCEITRQIVSIWNKITRNQRLNTQYQASKVLSDLDFEKVLKRIEYFATVINLKWQKAGLSGLISPVYPHSAFKRNASSDMNDMLEYTMLWTLVGYPVGVVPITTVGAEECYFKDHYDDRWSRLLDFNARDSTGLPIGVQVIGHAHQDEKVLGLMQMLETKLQIKVRPPVISEEQKGHFVSDDPRPTFISFKNEAITRATHVELNKLSLELVDGPKESEKKPTDNQS